MTKRSPGNNPHEDRRNWRPAETLEEYLHNCREGLETYSDSQAARILCVSRTELWRWQLMSELPEDLFESLLKAQKKPSSRSLANAAMALRTGETGESGTECCPHCGRVIRRRKRVNDAALKILEDYFENGGAR